MHIKPQAEPLSFDKHQYMLIDQAILGEFSEFEEFSISLAPDFNVLQKDQYPILVKFWQLNEEQKKQLFEYQQSYLDYYNIPVCSLMFKSTDIYEDAYLESYFKEMLYVEKNEKYYLRRIYDPRVILQLNWYDKNINLLNIIFGIFDSITIVTSFSCYTFNIIKSSKFEKINLNIDDINYINRLINLLKEENNTLAFLEYLSVTAYENLNFIKQNKINLFTKSDTVALLYHMKFLGKKILELNSIKMLIRDASGYEVASKRLSAQSWGNIFSTLDIKDLEIKNKVMYGY